MFLAIGRKVAVELHLEVVFAPVGQGPAGIAVRAGVAAVETE
jgi:hypothetical protein